MEKPYCAFATRSVSNGPNRLVWTLQTQMGEGLLPPVALLYPGHGPLAAQCPDVLGREVALILYLTAKKLRPA